LCRGDAHLMMPVVGASRGRATAGSPRAAIYLRVSTEGQVDGTSIDTQRAHCQALTRRHQFALAGEYVDAGVSGAASSRPALDELVAAATAGEIDVILVAKLDRLGRSLLHLLELVERLDMLGVRVLSATDGIDTRTPAGRMMLQLLGVFAEFERERLRERCQDGHHRRALEGGFVGTTAPFGYRAVPNPSGAAGFVLVIDPAQAACIRQMYRLLVHDRVPLMRVIKELNAAGHRSDSGAPWTKQTLSRWARGDGPTTAAGAWRWRELTVPIPPILTAVEHAEWTTWKQDTATPVLRHTSYLLGGRVRTPCGRYFHGRTAGTQSPVYVCGHRLQTPANSPARCGCRSIRVETLDEAVWSQVRAALTSPTLSANANRPGGRGRSASERDGGTTLDIGADTLAPRIADAAEDIARLQHTIADEYQAARQAGFDPATARLMLQTRREQLTSAQAALERLQRIREALTRVPDTTHADRQAVDRARVRIDELDLPDKQQLLDLLSVQAQVTGYHPCPTCAGTGYQPIPPDYDRRWPPSCPSCHRLRVLPDVTVEIGATHLLLTHPTAESRSPAASGPNTQTAG
jgi:DNA invertase Pin-like site-specific DNA recombinase